MKYPEIVALARFEASQTGVPYIVYEYRCLTCFSKRKIKYGYSTQAEFYKTLALGKFPMIRLLLCMPDGRIVQ